MLKIAALVYMLALLCVEWLFGWAGDKGQVDLPALSTAGRQPLSDLIVGTVVVKAH
ncbi:hypothetical protein [Vampirovibrio chlorellavorus]|uniref:hypothetical protein n=1 Tax=Vampirovibrio chlorellavorus TaxID=758823 RepID=UPI0026EC5D9E|nr:hypothetical protein [Vampirovibrio chlorellavorus]